MDEIKRISIKDGRPDKELIIIEIYLKNRAMIFQWGPPFTLTKLIEFLQHTLKVLCQKKLRIL